MDKFKEFLSNAELCRRLARLDGGEHQKALLKMAETWELLANEQKRDKGPIKS